MPELPCKTPQTLLLDCLFWIKRLGALVGLGVQPSDWKSCRELSVGSGWMWEREAMSWGRLSRERKSPLSVLYITYLM
jgi:hypothetical protein